LTIKQACRTITGDFGIANNAVQFSNDSLEMVLGMFFDLSKIDEKENPNRLHREQKKVIQIIIYCGNAYGSRCFHSK
jgi:hypothetical protein